MPGYFFPLLAAPVLQVVIYSNTDLPEDEFRAQTEKLRRVASYDNATRSLVRPNSLRPSRMGRRDAHGPLRCRPPPRHRGLGVRLSSAVIAAMAAPMIFELPFDLIVMARTYPPVPPDPVLYRTLFFAPLFLVELTTLSLLAVSPMVKLSRPAFFCLALMLLVFAVWALAGFGYPSAPIPIAMNVVSKILAFVTALSLFFPEWFTRWRRSQPDPGIEQAADASELQPQAA